MHVSGNVSERSQVCRPRPSVAERSFVVVDRVELTPRRGRDLDGKPRAPRPSHVALDVDVPADHDAVVLLERELRDLFARVPSGVLLEVLLDTCHSGTGLKDLKEIVQAQLLGRKPRLLPAPTRARLEKTRQLRAIPSRTRSIARPSSS